MKKYDNFIGNNLIKAIIVDLSKGEEKWIKTK